MNLKLNIVSFDVPYPPNYGGVIDVFYKIRALHDLGVKIVLHTFEYGRGRHEELEKYCSNVFYYKRDISLINQFSYSPYIVTSRANLELLENLCNNNYPILFEGLHTTYFIKDDRLKGRLKLVRTHNIEHEYYAGLAKKERNFLKYLFFNAESYRLKNYEKNLKFADLIYPLGIDDTVYFKEFYGVETVYVPVFSSNLERNLTKRKNEEKYILFHGDLSVQDNLEAINLLINNALGDSDFRVIIAGKNPSGKLLDITEKYDNILVVANPSVEEMDKLIGGSHIILMYSFQATGVKLKLIESLYKGRYILCNSNIVANTNLHDFSYVEDDLTKYNKLLSSLMKLDIKNSELKKRYAFLELNYNNIKSAEKIILTISQALQQT